MMTLPRPIGIVSAPGEKGHDAIVEDPEIHSFYFQAESGGMNSMKIVTEIEKTLLDLIAGKYGKIASLVFEGIHKMEQYLLDAVTAGAYFGGGDYDNWKCTPRARQWLRALIDRLCLNTIPVVAVTSWAEYEAERRAVAGEDSSKIPSHYYPAMMGKNAKEILGEFAITAFQTKRKEDGKDEYLWQLKPQGEVRGCRVILPLAQAQKLPTFCKATYADLMRVLEEVTK